MGPQRPDDVADQYIVDRVTEAARSRLRLQRAGRFVRDLRIANPEAWKVSGYLMVAAPDDHTIVVEHRHGRRVLQIDANAAPGARAALKTLPVREPRRVPRVRGAGRPRAQATRSSARSGDSGEDGSEPPARTARGQQYGGPSGTANDEHGGSWRLPINAKSQSKQYLTLAQPRAIYTYGCGRCAACGAVLALYAGRLRCANGACWRWCR